MEELGARPADVARALDVSVSTVYRWMHVGHAPRSALLALFWLTGAGKSMIDCDLYNDATQLRGLVNALMRERRASTLHMPRVAANDPVTRWHGTGFDRVQR
ncbi:hypothetical protein GTZ97_14920 [Aquabacterium fontiphilum]|uniref:helix-turn-helix domain-containing protein n=1 Tax=Aquabacterium fontiphilum TaxID=450365 RepID=UPI0013787468|nr:helix-turn-helix domain-containing protein [Aquabacterium fontiphilum]NBD21951.1 hypothetical protein [Aquabacterium fontiphilum]